MSETIMNRSANIGGKLVYPMKASRVSTVSLASRMKYSQPLISKLRSGKANLQYEQVESLLESVPKQSGHLMIDILNQLSNGLIPPSVDGKFLYLTPSSMEDRVLEEAKQASQALLDASDEFGRPIKSLDDFRDPEEAFNQLYDLTKYSLALEIVIGEHIGWDTPEVQKRCREREAYLKKHKYQIV